MEYIRQLVVLIGRQRLTNKDASFLIKGRLYRSCKQSCILHGDEKWPVKKENKLALQRFEIRMIRWMCGIKQIRSHVMS